MSARFPDYHVTAYMSYVFSFGRAVLAAGPVGSCRIFYHA